LFPGRGVLPIPEPEVPKGLLPGRGPIGRGGIEPGFDAGGVDGVPGIVGALKVGAAGPFGASGFTSAGFATSGSTAFSTTASTTGGATTSETSSLEVLVAAFFATFLAAGFSGAAAAGASGNSARSLRATGASMDDDAPLTNSPNSASLAITTLLSTPRSFAIS
jgi:hypothetical protein